MKKLVALFLSLVLALAMGIPAVAESAEKSTLTIMVPENDPAARPFQIADLSSGAATTPVWEAFVKLLDSYNLNLEFEAITNSQYAVVSQTRLAAGLDLPDILNTKNISDSLLISYANTGILLPVSDIIEEYCTEATKETIETNYPFIRGMTVNPADGKSYFFGAVDSYMVDGEFKLFTIDLHIRYDWLTKLGLDMPTTTDELLEIGKAFHEKDANGVIGDEKFVISENKFYGLGDYFGLVPQLLFGMMRDGDEILCPWYQEGAKDYFEFMQKIYKEGLVEIGNYTTQLNAENALIGSYQYAYQHHFEDTCTDPECFYAPLTLLTGVDGIEPVARQDPIKRFPSESFTFAVTNACTDLAAVGRFMDLLYSPEYQVLTIAGIEGVTYTLTEGNGDIPVMNTNIQFAVSDGDVTAMRETGLCKGYRLWGKGILPRITTVNVLSSYIEKQIADYEAAGDWKNAMRYQTQLEEYSITSVSPVSLKLAMPTDEEAERINELTTDLETYAAELWSNLVTGAASLDDWDQYISDMQEMGLDELLEIEQTLLDRLLDA